MSEKINSLIESQKEKIQDVRYVMSCDYTDKHVSAYCLGRVQGDNFEVVIAKQGRDSEAFKEEVLNLAKYFDAELKWVI